MKTMLVVIRCALIGSLLATGGAVQAQTNHPPVPVVTVSDNLVDSEYQGLAWVISPDGSSIEVVFDASASWDADGDALQFMWGEFDEGLDPFAYTARASRVFSAQSLHYLGVVVSDGSASVIAQLRLRIVTPAQAVEVLIDAIKDDAQPDGKPRQSLLGPLEDALTSFENGDTRRAIHSLEVFQGKARVQAVTSDLERAEEVERITQLILDKVR